MVEGMFAFFAIALLVLSPFSLKENAPPAPERYAVIIVLDGARADDFNLVAMPNLQALLRRGVRYSNAFVGQELANTPPSHATIGTGMLPKHHGVEGFLWEDPQTHLMTDPTEISNVLSGALESVITGHHVPSLAGQLHRTYPKARVVSVAAHKCYASDAMGTATTDYILCALIYHNRWVAQAIGDHRPPPGAINDPKWDVPIPPRTSGFGAAVQQWRVGTENAWTVRYALWAMKRVHYPRVLMMNLSETDVLGHFTSNVAVIRYLMKEFDSLLGQIIAAYRSAGLLDRTDFVITADHGMTQITVHIPYSVLTRSVALAGTTPVYIEHDTAAAIGITDDSKARAVALNILRLGGKAVDATYYKVLVRGRWSYRLAGAQSTVPAALRAAYFRLANTMAADSGPDVFAVFAPHASTRSTVAYGYSWKAGHLGPQWGDQHIPLVLAGPGIKSGVTSGYPARLVDVAPTVENLLGVPSGAVDGVALQDALQQPTTEGLARQASRGKELMPVVQALQRRSGY